MGHHEILRSLSEVAIAITGFSGIVAALTQAAGVQVDLPDRVALSELLGTSLGVALFGYVPDLFSAAFVSEPVAWRGSIFLFACFHLVSISGALLDRRRILASEAGKAGLPDNRMQIPAFGVGFLICALQLAIAAGFFGAWTFFAYLLGMLWLLAIAAWMFCDRLMSGLRVGQDD